MVKLECNSRFEDGSNHALAAAAAVAGCYNSPTGLPDAADLSNV